MMHPNKASKLLSDYALNNFNAKKTLIENGYSETTADKESKTILERANRVVKDKLQLNQTNTIQETAKTSLDILGIDRERVVKQLEKIAFNDRDYTNAIKILSVLAKDIGINLTDTEQQKTPPVNIIVERVETTGATDSVTDITAE
jgi:hypothetical protein